MTEEVNKTLLSMPYEDRHKLIPASYLVLKRGDTVLLLRRFNTGYEDGKYSMPAGHVDAGETFTETVIREASEEIGIIVEAENVRMAHIMHRKSVYTERIDTFFTTEEWTGEPKNMEPNKCDDLSWFPLDKLPENTIPYIRQALECIRDGKFYSEFGW
jgi:ADP-ribose pyrophosphatase YjhB (NUDIX family)